MADYQLLSFTTFTNISNKLILGKKDKLIKRSYTDTKQHNTNAHGCTEIHTCTWWTNKSEPNLVIKLINNCCSHTN